VVIGTVRNDSFKDVKLDASKLTVKDGDGRPLRSSAQFAASFAHGLYGAYQKPNPLPPDELSRLGLRVTIRPGQSAPLTVAFRVRRETRQPVRIDYGEGLLPVPRRAETPPKPS
jgi:hypothetical protein